MCAFVTLLWLVTGHRTTAFPEKRWYILIEWIYSQEVAPVKKSASRQLMMHNSTSTKAIVVHLKVSSIVPTRPRSYRQGKTMMRRLNEKQHGDGVTYIGSCRKRRGASIRKRRIDWRIRTIARGDKHQSRDEMVQLTAGWVVKEEESAAINDKWIKSNENEIMKHDGGKLLLLGSERAGRSIGITCVSV